MRLLGENLVAFRDSSGRVGVMDELCPHRGASLVLARNENDALQCLYHGWRIAADGEIVETPCEPRTATSRTVSDTSRSPFASWVESSGYTWDHLAPSPISRISPGRICRQRTSH